MKNVRVVELFSGIGAQIRGIQNSGLFDVESVAIADIDKDAVLSYAAMHHGLTPELIETYNYPSREEMIVYLQDLNLGYDFEKRKAYNWERVKDAYLRKYYLACKITNNYGDISKINNLPECDLLTFSAPCTDISMIGLHKGMVAGKTRSGLVWEVLRLLNKLKDERKLPKYLLMENVKHLVSNEFIDDFNVLNEMLKDIGYTAYWKVLNARDCGIPQDRQRVFGVYIRDDIDTGKFTFPDPFNLGIEPINLLLTASENEEKRLVNVVNKWVKNGEFNTAFTAPKSYEIHDIPKFLNNIRKGCYGGIVEVADDINQVSCEIRLNKYFQLRSYYSDYIVTLRAIKKCGDKYVITAYNEGKDIHVRGLLPEEAFSLMGFTDEDAVKCRTVGVSSSLLYKQAGNSIVTMCIQLIMEHLYKAFFDENYIPLDSLLSGYKIIKNEAEIPYGLVEDVIEIVKGVYLIKEDTREATEDELLSLLNS